MENGPNRPAGSHGGRGRRRRRGRRGQGAQAGQGQPAKGTQGSQGQQHGGQHHRPHGAGPAHPKQGHGGQQQRGPRPPRPPRPSRAPKHPDAELYSAPMDHSYRTVQNGNQNSNGRTGGRPRPGFGAKQFMQPELEPLPVSQDANSAPKIFAFIEDLFFVAKINETARKLNVKVQFVKSEKDITDAMEANGNEPPTLVIVDLNNNVIKPIQTISKLKSKFKKGTNVIGFLSHVQGDLKLKAQEAGCDMVLPRSAFSANLPQLLRRHAAGDEMDEEQ